jgi:hypothetical protein
MTATRFYVFRQNPSFQVYDEGVGHIVLVEASTCEEANLRAQEVGVYFNGVALGRDCDCCGPRWWPVTEEHSVSVHTPRSQDALEQYLSEYGSRTVVRVVYLDEQEFFTRGRTHRCRKLRAPICVVPRTHRRQLPRKPRTENTDGKH